MTKWVPAPVIGGAYSDDTRPWSVQDTVNYIPVAAERPGTRSMRMLRGAPGMVKFVDLGTNAPIRGMRNVEGLLLVVSGSSLFKVSTNGVVTNLGTIPGVSRVSMAHNQITNGNQVAIANGVGGYVYNTATGVLSAITDEGFPGAISFDYADSYITGIEPGRRFAFTSDLADATSYNTLDQYEAEGSPDLLVGQIVTHREWWLFGQRTIEPYQNTGASEGTWQRASGTVLEVGAASPYAIVNLDNSVFWLGNDGIVYRANGYTPVPVSTRPIEQAISRCDLTKAFAFTYEDRGHKIFYLTFQDGKTWGYDVTTQEWHRRKSSGLDRWRINALVSWNGKWIGGDYQNGKLYTLDWDVSTEDGMTLQRRRITGVLHDNQNAVIVNAVALVFDTGQKSPPPPENVLRLFGNAPGGDVGEVYNFSYTASGGDLPRVYSITGGSLPAGLTLDPDTGVISGIPTTKQTSDFTIVLTSADDQVVSRPQSIVIGATVLASTLLEDGPIMLLPLDELTGTTAHDITGNGHDGTYHGVTLNGGSVLGTRPTAHFPGTASLGYVSVPSTSPIEPTNDFTIEMLVSEDANHQGSSISTLYTRFLSEDDGTSDYAISIVPYSFHDAFGASINASGYGSYGQAVSGAISRNRTYLLGIRSTLVTSSHQFDVFLNGIKVGTGSGPVVSMSSGDLTIGSGSSRNDLNGFAGLVGYVTYYDKILSDARMFAHAQAAGVA